VRQRHRREKRILYIVEPARFLAVRDARADAPFTFRDESRGWLAACPMLRPVAQRPKMRLIGCGRALLEAKALPSSYDANNSREEMQCANSILTLNWRVFAKR
jgi:hypothetical protein